MLYLVKCFSAFLDMTILFLYFIFLWFIALMDLCMLNNTCAAGMKSLDYDVYSFGLFLCSMVMGNRERVGDWMNMAFRQGWGEWHMESFRLPDDVQIDTLESQLGLCYMSL